VHFAFCPLSFCNSLQLCCGGNQFYLREPHRPWFFFHQSTHSRALIHGLKPFRIWHRIPWKIRDICLKWSASAVSMRPRKRILRFQWDRGSRFGGFIESAEVASTVPMSRFWRFSNQISRRTRSHMRNGFSPWSSVLGRFDWNRGTKISWHCFFKSSLFPITELTMSVD
jgi:hypothetical protein